MWPSRAEVFGGLFPFGVRTEDAVASACLLGERCIMPTLVIHAPHSEAQHNQKQSFRRTFETGTGEGYAISRGLVQQLSPGDPVIVICKVHRQQASGTIRKLVPTVKAGNGIQRYDVIMDDLELVPFDSADVRLNRNGVAII